MKTRREFLKSMAAVIWMCGVLTGCSVSMSSYVKSDDTTKDDSTYNPPDGVVTKPDNQVPNLEAYRKEVLRLVNEEREKAGVGRLEMDDSKLTDAAQVRAKEIVEFFSHTRPDGRECGTAYFDQGGRKPYIGENIAAGYVTPEEVVDGWMHSEGHRWNILHEKYKKIGIGYYYQSNSKYVSYWVQMFTD